MEPHAFLRAFVANFINIIVKLSLSSSGFFIPDMCFCIYMFLHPCKGWDVFGVGLLTSPISLKLLLTVAYLKPYMYIRTKMILGGGIYPPSHSAIVLLLLVLPLFVELSQKFLMTEWLMDPSLYSFIPRVFMSATILVAKSVMRNDIYILPDS